MLIVALWRAALLQLFSWATPPTDLELVAFVQCVNVQTRSACILVIHHLVMH